MAVVNPTAAGESNEVDLSDKLATREVPPTKNTSHLADQIRGRHSPTPRGIGLGTAKRQDTPFRVSTGRNETLSQV